ncbi:class I SAM-dependent methyltransferase [Candidatus Poribacteria bacterium]|nr:class I SAM-dependent methyltransferase [Candidatus Poribacteria bacterium]
MNEFYSVSSLGQVYVPVEYRDAVFSRGGVKLFSQQELHRHDRIFTHIQRGGIVVVEGSWDDICDVMDYVQRHKKELTPSKNRSRSRDRSHRDNPKQVRESILTQLMCLADKNGIIQVSPTPDLPYLLELIGEENGANQDLPFLVPVIKVQRLNKALEDFYPINALNVSIQASENVLAPRSQETIECFQEAIQNLNINSRIENPTVAEIGCGSGCLTILAQQEMEGNVEIYTSDLLAEAVATTKINVERHLPNSENIHILESGDLFDPFPSKQFDIIIFNAPWVVARVRNRSEIAIHDEKQQTLERFFKNLPNYLKPDGILLLGYADASGPKAISNLEKIIDESEYICKDIVKRRVATHRSKKKWEHIQVYIITHTK